MYESSASSSQTVLEPLTEIEVESRKNQVSPDPISAPVEEPSYWELSRQPLPSLLFLAPLIAGLEFLKWNQATGGESLAGFGVESWIQNLQQYVGLDLPWILPAATVSILIGWHIIGRYRSELRPRLLLGMASESLMYACLLVVIGQMQDYFFEHAVYRSPLAIEDSTGIDFQSRIVMFVGSGLYEEVLFRLCLLPIIWGILKLLTVPHRLAAGFAVILTSIAFAAAHHLTAEADPISSLSLSFRIVAGLFLSVLFLRRGFGVTAGCHSAYDVLVGVIMQSRN